MVKRLFFASHNLNKAKEAQDILGVKIELAGFEVDEIQSIDPVEVAVKKARGYYQRIKKPIFAEDTSFFIRALNNLPGPFIDYFMKSLGNEGILRLVEGEEDRRVSVQTTVVFIDKKKKEQIFIGKVEGNLAKSPRGNGFGWDPIFIPQGSVKTFGEMTLEEKNLYSMRAKALRKFKTWLKRFPEAFSD